MIKKIIFYTLLSLTTINFASEQGNRPWFTQVANNSTFKTFIVLTCRCKLIPSAEFKEGLHLVLDDQGNLYAQFKQEKELLLQPPETILDIKEARIDFSPSNRVEIIVPYKKF